MQQSRAQQSQPLYALTVRCCTYARCSHRHTLACFDSRTAAEAYASSDTMAPGSKPRVEVLTYYPTPPTVTDYTTSSDGSI